MRQYALSLVKKKRISKAYQGAQKKQYNEGHADFYTTTSLRETITEKRQTHCRNGWCHDDRVYQPVIPQLDVNIYSIFIVYVVGW
jgi:hypothetical protein